ncbi:hypothetical protein [Streptomyces sp. NPDC004014]
MCEEFASVCRAVWNTVLHQRREDRRRGAWLHYAPQTWCSCSGPARRATTAPAR